MYGQITSVISLFRDAGCEIALITNGTRLPRLGAMAEVLTYVQVSLIAPTVEGYVDATGRNDFGRTWSAPATIRDLCNVRRPTVGGMFVISDSNVRDVEDVIARSRDAGFDYCSFRVAVDYERRGVGLSVEATEHLMGLIDRLPMDAVAFTNLPAALQRAAPRYRSSCVAVGANLYGTVTADGSVYLCVPDVGDPDYCIGTLGVDGTLEDIWAGRRHAELQSALQKRYSVQGCAAQCRAHAYNEALMRKRPSVVSRLHGAFF